jgi:AraC-like DNA-binding protein
MSRIAFSSSDLGPKLDDDARFKLFHDLYVENYGAADLSKHSHVPFKMRMELAVHGNVSVGNFSGRFAKFKRGRNHLAVDGADGFCLAINLAGSDIGANIRGPSVLRPRAAMISSFAEPGEFVARDAVSWAAVCLPRGALAQFVRNPDDLVGQTIPPDSAALQILIRYLDVINEPTRIHRPLNDHIATTLIDLVGLALHAPKELQDIALSRGLKAARAHELLSDIRRNYAQSGISPSSVARRLGMSVRYLHALLEDTGLSFGQHVTELRLQKAKTMLEAPGAQVMTIAEIGSRCGFEDTSHFVRRFRRRFEISPGAYRSQLAQMS